MLHEMRDPGAYQLATTATRYTTQLQEEADYAVSLAFRAHVEPLLRQYRVNLMLVGHQHSYERSCAACVAGTALQGHACPGLSPVGHLRLCPCVCVCVRRPSGVLAVPVLFLHGTLQPHALSAPGMLDSAWETASVARCTL